MHGRADMFVEAGLWLRLCGDQEGARRLFERALQVDPHNARAREHLSDHVPESTTLAAEASALMDLMPPAAESPRPAETPAPPVSATCAWELDGASCWELADGKGAPGDALDVLVGDNGWSSADEEAPVAEMPEPAPMPRGELDVLLEGASDLLGLDDCTGALELLRSARALGVADGRITELEARAERVLMAMLESKLGDPRAVPRMKLQPDEIIWLNLDHRAGFVLAQVDGRVSYDDLFALSGMPRLDTARILTQLLEEGVIASIPSPAGRRPG